MIGLSNDDVQYTANEGYGFVFASHINADKESSHKAYRLLAEKFKLKN